MKDGRLLVTALRDPASTAALDADGWIALLTMARAEQLIGTLAFRLEGQPMPDGIAAIFEDARTNADYQRKTALWEADAARRALASYQGKVVQMKGTAYVAEDLQAGIGRSIGDLDIMVEEDDLREVEKLLLAAGWEWVKEDEYDDAYYRDHMHELPPLIHKTRDRMIDVHHTILPKTAKPTPDAKAMLGNGIIGSDGLAVFTPADMVCHSAAHLFADGDLAGGLRNLWDIYCLLMEFSRGSDSFHAELQSRAQHHQLEPAVSRAIRLTGHLYGDSKAPPNITDRFYIRRLTARNGCGQQTRKFTRFAFYVRSHLLRMPPMMLAKHLWTKWRKG